MTTHVHSSNLPARDLTATDVAIGDLKVLSGSIRRHPKSQIDKLAHGLAQFGFVVPILIDAQRRIVAGGALVEAAKRLSMSHVPAITVTGLTEAELRALRIALNRLAEDAEWDIPALKLEFETILGLDAAFDLTITGFEMGEIDFHLHSETEPEPPVELPDQSTIPVSQIGDLWALGRHRLLCGNALEETCYEVLLGEVRARCVITDVPYNLKLKGIVTGKGQVVHDEFVMASGEMDDAAFIDFLRTSLGCMARCSIDGALHYVFIDWRHLHQLMTAADAVYSELKNLVVWNKSNGGMGSFYRSKHELIALYKVGAAPHINNVALGRFGRNRTNVWDYAGVNTFRAGRMEDLAAHPTVKPTALIADALMDATNRGDAVLDPFLGSGTTLLACEQTGRIGYGMELDPRYVDVAIRRWQSATGETAQLTATGESFTEVTARRRTEVAARPNDVVAEVSNDR